MAFIPLIALSAGTVFAEDQKKVLIPFDFVSKFDDGRYGQMVGEMIWKKINGEGGFILPESMQDVRDYCQSHHILPSPDDSLDKMKKIVKEDFDGQIGIWGSVERAPGTEGEIYDLAIKCVDFSAAPEPKVIYETKSRTKSVSEIPHLYVKQMLDALYRRQSGESYSVDPVAEANWNKNPNLVGGGDFQTGTGGVLKGWESVGGQQREPLGKLVQWVAEEGNPQNKIIRFTFDKAVAEEEGVMYYSDYFPVEEGAKYRFQCRWKTNGPNVKVFIKCYDEVNTPYQKNSDGPDASATSRKGSKDRNPPETAQRREVYRSQQNLKGPKNAWNTHTEDFTPTHTKYSPKWGRVMLYAYLKAGVVEFDDVIVKQILPPPKQLDKEPRQSLGTRVTIKEMEENERRSNEAKKQENK
ncbi:MAG: hypothetical protein ABSE63_03220 [Thermoguttaceae bacterium]